MQLKGRPLNMFMGLWNKLLLYKTNKTQIYTKCFDVEMCTLLSSEAGIQILFCVDESVSSKSFSGGGPS